MRLPAAEGSSLPPAHLVGYPEGVPREVDFPRVPVTRLLDETAARSPDRTAIRFLGSSISYRELKDDVDRLATSLAALGIEKADRVALLLPNSPHSVISYYAVLRLGAVVVQCNPLYTETELIEQLRDAGAQTIVTLDLRALLPKALAARHRGAVRTIVCGSLADYLPAWKRLAFRLAKHKDLLRVTAGDDVLSFRQLIRAHPPRPPRVDIDPATDLAMLQYTGGTTGVAKGAMLTHANVVANTLQCKLWFPEAADGGEVALSVLPFFHSFGLTLCLNLPVAAGYTSVILPKPDINAILAAIVKERPTFFPGVPTLFNAINNHPKVGDADLSSIKFCISGGAPLPLQTLEAFEELTGAHLVEGYGLTEASPVTHCNPLNGARKAGSIGFPLTGTGVKIVDVDTGCELATGQPGEILVSGPQVMKGYWHHDVETARAFADGWLRTGDIGYIDDEGYTFVVDRMKDMIISGGYNIYPRDVEEVLHRHPKVKEAVVVGIPDHKWGESVRAFVVVRDGRHATEQEIIAFCKQNLRAYAVPKRVEFRPELPRTAIGKALRRVLKEEASAAPAAHHS